MLTKLHWPSWNHQIFEYALDWSPRAGKHRIKFGLPPCRPNCLRLWNAIWVAPEWHNLRWCYIPETQFESNADQDPLSRQPKSFRFPWKQGIGVWLLEYRRHTSSRARRGRPGAWNDILTEHQSVLPQERLPQESVLSFRCFREYRWVVWRDWALFCPDRAILLIKNVLDKYCQEFVREWCYRFNVKFRPSKGQNHLIRTPLLPVLHTPLFSLRLQVKK